MKTQQKRANKIFTTGVISHLIAWSMTIGYGASSYANMNTPVSKQTAQYKVALEQCQIQLVCGIPENKRDLACIKRRGKK